MAMAKLPTRSPTHEDIPLARLSAMGLELEEIAEISDNGAIDLPALIELAEDRGRPPSHYLAAVALATELRVAPEAPLTVRVCAGNCQRWGALDVLDHLAERAAKQLAAPGGAAAFAIVPVSCLDRCDQAPACELVGDHGRLVVAPATPAALDEALRTLAGSTG